MKRTGFAALVLAGALVPLKPDFSSFPPSLENAAWAQKRSSNGDIQRWIKEGGASELIDPDENTRLNAAWKLRYAVDDGADISLAQSALTKALADGNQNVKGYAAFALCMMHMLKNEWAKSAALLKHPDSEVRVSAAWAVGSAAEKRMDLTSALPALQKALSDENELVRWNASKALSIHYLAAGARKKFAALLKSENDDIRQGAEEASRVFRPR
jgi:HEAT repeat protein